MAPPGPPPLLPDDDDLDQAPEPMPGATPEALRLDGQPAPGCRPLTLHLLLPPEDLGAARAVAQLGALASYLHALGITTLERWQGDSAALSAAGWRAPRCGPAPQEAHISAGPHNPHTAPLHLPLGDTTADPELAPLTQAHPEVLRLALLDAPRGAALHLDQASLDRASQRLEYLYDALHRANQALALATSIPERGSLLAPVSSALPELMGQLHQALCADLDTAAALQVLERFARATHEVNPHPGRLRANALYTVAAARGALVQAAAPLGLLQRYPEEALRQLRQRHAQQHKLPTQKIETLIKERAQARASRDWQAADRLLEELHGLGVEVMDQPGGTSWRPRQS